MSSRPTFALYLRPDLSTLTEAAPNWLIEAEKTQKERGWDGIHLTLCGFRPKQKGVSLRKCLGDIENQSKPNLNPFIITGDINLRWYIFRGLCMINFNFPSKALVEVTKYLENSLPFTSKVRKKQKLHCTLFDVDKALELGFDVSSSICPEIIQNTLKQVQVWHVEIEKKIGKNGVERREKIILGNYGTTTEGQN